MKLEKSTLFPVAFLMILSIFLINCGGGTGPSASVSVGYSPPFVPISFHIDSNGTISVETQAEIPTPIGTFSISANVSQSLNPDDETLDVIIRHRQPNGAIADTVYSLSTEGEEVKVTTNGHTVIDITHQKVFIDVSDGSVQNIDVVGVNPVMPTPTQPAPAGTLVQSSLRNIQVVNPNPGGYSSSPSCYSDNLGYHDVSTPGGCEYSTQEYGDATVSVTAELVRGNDDGSPTAYGLEVRGGYEKGYELSITSDGQWTFPFGLLQAPHKSDAIHTGVGAINTLKVKMKGGHFTLFINGTQVGEDDEDTPPGSYDSSGTIGFDADYSYNCEVIFTDLLVTAP